VHVLDASRAVPVTTSLLSADKSKFVEQHDRDYAELRKRHAAPTRALPSLAEARARRPEVEFGQGDIPAPHKTGIQVLEDFPLTTLRDYIDWTPFFHTWELKGIYPRIFEHETYGEQARSLFADAQKLLDRIVREKLLRASAVYGLFPANAVGDDVELYTDETRRTVLTRFCFLRQQRDDAPCRSLSDFVAPRETALPDHLGAFAVTTGLGTQELVKRFKAEHDDYNAIMAEALADRLAEAFAEYLHQRVRGEWGYGQDEKLSPAELIKEGYRGIRPAAGYPACPDHTEKGTLWQLLDVAARAGIELTESYAMWPGASVSGLYFAHPKSHYFTLGKIGRDQVEDYAQRKGLTVAEVERWLAPNLSYDPA
jgi:5-methyltetrahydrofolate--homocysteine methyltransferase